MYDTAHVYIELSRQLQIDAARELRRGVEGMADPHPINSGDPPPLFRGGTGGLFEGSSCEERSQGSFDKGGAR